MDFLAGLDGVELFEAEYVSNFNGAKTKNHAIKVIGKVDFNNHYMLEHFKFLKQAVDKYGDGSQVAKFSIPSPNMLFTRIQGDEYYNGNRELFYQDTVAAYQKAIQAFYDAGCRYLQLDDTSWIDFVSEDRIQAVVERLNMDVQDIIADRVRCLNEAIAKKPEDMIITMHICRGNFRSTYITSGGYDQISDAIFADLKVDDRDCPDILLQIAAIRKALDNTAKLLLTDHIETCVVDAVHQGNEEQVLEDMKKALVNFIR